MEDRQWMNIREYHLRECKPDLYRWPFPVDRPWEHRSSMPIFRGTGWNLRGATTLCQKQGSSEPTPDFYEAFLALQPKRWKAKLIVRCGKHPFQPNFLRY